MSAKIGQPILTSGQRVQQQPPRQRPQHLCIRPLTVYDLDQVEALEASGFDDAERASREKLKYRLIACPELSSGLFVREFEDIGAEAVEKNAPSANKKTKKDKDDSDDEEDDGEFILPPPRSTVKKETLIGHVIGTKMYDQKITERSMGIPKLTDDYLPDSSVPGNDKIGHIEASRVIGIHSVVIHQNYRGLKLGSLLVKDYLQKMNQQCVADRVVLIAKSKLVPFYKNIEFVDDGISDCKFADSEWHDLHCVLTHEEDEDDM
ncbi:DEKNAAC100018 [Brettanomyces naardenensis]|uniref:DEKNAAC100018 n=1 Tax=Brettanomyces naardenensis TaxID=13370 RepID=A0A448YF47_BRENA|nr:DEKNAAC100018 [Brettanomyces naardenensis]